MENIMVVIMDNLSKVSTGFLLFLIVYTGNMALGIWNSIKIKKIDFDWKLLVESVVKCLVLVYGVGAICIGVTAIPEYINYVGIPIPTEYSETVSIAILISAVVAGIYIYAKDGLEKIKSIFSKKENRK